MESQVARRRINTISAHFAAEILTEDVTPPNSHLIPLNCNNNLSTSFKRLDNRLLFGRQSSAAQGHFMKHATESEEQNCSSNVSTSFRRLDNRLLFGRQSSASQGYFMRQAMDSEEQGNQVPRPRVCTAKCGNEVKTTAPEPPSYSHPGSAGPLFARPVQEDLNSSDIGVTGLVKQDKMLPASECHTSAMPQQMQVKQDKMLPASECHTSATLQQKQVSCPRQMISSQNNGTGWSPRINVIESKRSYVITVELPGVEINDIRVEMDDKNLIVRGKRLMKWWKTAGCSNDSFATYHRREISQGPYQLTWPLPPGANKESVSAELVEGILHVTIPKL